MDKCRDCNSTMKKGEKACYACGARVPEESAQSVYGQRFATALKIFFLASVGLTVISLFMSGLSFTKCSIMTVILFIIKSSADQMLEKGKT
jgi:uncharacterized membrane protein